MRTHSNKEWTSAAARRLIAAAGGSASVADAIVTVVERLRDGVPGPPTDLELVAQRLGVDSCASEPLPVAGELRRVAGRLSIVYSVGLSIGRRRFTIAHELGHAFFESSGPNCPRRGPELERICDLFAAELLMPRIQALAVMQRRHPQSIVDAAKTFDVSVTAAMYRMVELTGVQGAIDVDGRRTATFRALRGPDERIDELIDAARTHGEAAAVMRLTSNPCWSGNWSVNATVGARQNLIVLTADPIDQVGMPMRLRSALRHVPVATAINEPGAK